MLSWIILIIVITAMIIWFSSREDDRYGNPLGKTDFGYQLTRVEGKSMSRAYASEIRIKKNKPKKSFKKRSKRK